MTVGSDLEGIAEIRVAIVTAKGQIDTATLRGETLKLSFIVVMDLYVVI